MAARHVYAASPVEWAIPSGSDILFGTRRVSPSLHLYCPPPVRSVLARPSIHPRPSGILVRALSRARAKEKGI